MSKEFRVEIGARNIIDKGTLNILISLNNKIYDLIDKKIMSHEFLQSAL